MTFCHSIENIITSDLICLKLIVNIYYKNSLKYYMQIIEEYLIAIFIKLSLFLAILLSVKKVIALFIILYHQILYSKRLKN